MPPVAHHEDADTMLVGELLSPTRPVIEEVFEEPVIESPLQPVAAVFADVSIRLANTLLPT
jgi:hypothetical protein